MEYLPEVRVLITQLRLVKRTCRTQSFSLLVDSLVHEDLMGSIGFSPVIEMGLTLKHAAEIPTHWTPTQIHVEVRYKGPQVRMKMEPTLSVSNRYGVKPYQKYLRGSSGVTHELIKTKGC